MSQEIIGFKLLSGEELIGRKESETEENVILSKVRVLQMVQTGPQQMGMALAPYMASAMDNDIPIMKSAMATAPLTPIDDVEKAYLQQTTSIQLAQ